MIRKKPTSLLGKEIFKSNTGIAEVRKRIVEMFFKLFFTITTGLNKAIRPRIKDKFTMLEPSKFPMDIPIASSDTAEKVTTASGKEVATAKSKNPNIISPSLVILAIFSAFLTVKSLEKESIAKNIMSKAPWIRMLTTILN